MAPAPARAQAVQAGSAPSHADEATRQPDVVVNGLRDEGYPVTEHASPQFAIEARLALQAASEAKLFSRCLSTSDADALRLAIDSRPNRGARITGLDRLTRDHQACYPGYQAANNFVNAEPDGCRAHGQSEPIIDPRTRSVVGKTTRFLVCQAFFDRGAVVERALALYAPNLNFTTADLSQPAVVARFNDREAIFNQTRPPAERLYAVVTNCLVFMRPALSLALLRSGTNSGEEAKLRRALIGTTAQCVGGARQVNVNAAEFRVFMADAVYFWAAALRGAASLVPSKVSGALAQPAGSPKFETTPNRKPSD